MGCAQFSKQTRSKNPSSQKTNLDCSIQLEKQRYNPDFMKKGCQMSDLNDYSLVVIDNKKKVHNEVEQQKPQDDFKDNSQDEKNTISSKSEKNPKSSKPVVPAQMQLNWQLKNNICVSSLLQRRSICHQSKPNSITLIQQE